MKVKIISLLLITYIQLLPMDHHNKSTSLKKFCFTHALTLAYGALGASWVRLDNTHKKLSNNTKHLFALKCYLSDLVNKDETEETRTMRSNYRIKHRGHSQILTKLELSNQIEFSITGQLKLPAYYQNMVTQALGNLKTHVSQNDCCRSWLHNNRCDHLSQAVDSLEKIRDEIVNHNAAKISKIRGQKKQVERIAYTVAGVSAAIGLYSWLKSK